MLLVAHSISSLRWTYTLGMMYHVSTHVAVIMRVYVAVIGENLFKRRAPAMLHSLADIEAEAQARIGLTTDTHASGSGSGSRVELRKVRFTVRRVFELGHALGVQTPSQSLTLPDANADGDSELTDETGAGPPILFTTRSRNRCSISTRDQPLMEDGMLLDWHKGQS